ncbi:MULTISPECIES: alpha-1,2-fucosyltransferase [Chromobacteriaceae]|uniref:alpha-1,2-fucosyltransferase n=1 Tax=Chromobacteriaceae TaxID=1499392 RepID=UPI0009DC4457|nr:MULTISPECIES: alpha-1,2-fucosyltransferase [Chromobacteriaceae]AVG15865.1 hypothetical protein CFN79_08340 [Chromobacterium vaccinii]
MAIIVKVMGGLASQLHKYAVGRALSLKHNQELKLDLTWFEATPLGDTPRMLLLDRFHVEYKVASHSEIKILKGSRLRNALASRVMAISGVDLSTPTRFSGKRLNDFSHDKKGMSFPSCGAYLEGELVGDGVFSDIREKLLLEFTLRPNFITSEVREMAEKMQMSHSVAIHIRRGDYLSNPNALRYHVSCGLAYFQSAMNIMKKRTGEYPLSFFLFSDDIEWLQENMKNFPAGAEVVKDFTDEQSFFLLSKCKHFVISNSGFSWLAAWAGYTENSVVIAPTVWLKDKNKNNKHVQEMKFGEMVLVDNE